MRAVVLVMLGLVGGAAFAASDTVPSLAGSYDVAFKDVGNTCAVGGLSMEKGTFTLEQSGVKLTVSLPVAPIMHGSAAAGGKFQARAKRGKTAVQGLDGEFSIGGTVNAAGEIDLVLVADYFRAGKPFCQQSWNGKGKRK